MKPWRSKGLLLAAAGAACLAIPAASQDRPESILPPGFGDPAAPPPPPAPPSPSSPPNGPASTPPSSPPSGAPRPEPRVVLPAAESDEAGEGDEVELVPPPPPVEMPEQARRSPGIVGTIGESEGGLAVDAFGNANGRFLSTLMRRARAPLPSRWAHIALRRALLSRTPAPAGVHPVDWIAERAWLLIRMGEADAARMLVQAVDVDRFTPKMYDIAVQAGLATADPVALCPLIERGRSLGNTRIWPLVRAMCAGLSGEGGRASAEVNQARRQRGGARGIDLLLAEKVVGAGSGTRRAVTIQWDGVDRLTAWRFGLANATGVVIPSALFATTGAQARAWQARAPLITLAERLPYAKSAAAMGVFSNASLVQFYSMMGDDLDVAEIRDSDPGRLQLAYIGSGAGRIAALRALWRSGGEGDDYANHVLTAAASTRLRPDKSFADDAGDLVGAMFAGGFARHAQRWSGFVDGLDGGKSDRAWAMLAVGAAERSVDSGSGRIDDFIGRDASRDKLRSRLLVAALAGLGRIDQSSQQRFSEALKLPLGGQNSWTLALDGAARSGQPGSVALLAAIGMQAPDWRSVPPRHLYRILRALRASGQDYAARMIAAEALGRT